MARAILPRVVFASAQAVTLARRAQFLRVTLWDAVQTALATTLSLPAYATQALLDQPVSLRLNALQLCATTVVSLFLPAWLMEPLFALADAPDFFRGLNVTRAL
jgi:hypothetical protein